MMTGNQMSFLDRQIFEGILGSYHRKGRNKIFCHLEDHLFLFNVDTRKKGTQIFSKFSQFFYNGQNSRPYHIMALEK